MSDERIGMEKAFPMFMLGLGCILATAIVFSILFGRMIRARRQIERQQQKEKDKENEEQEKLLNIYTIPIPERNSLQKLMDTAKNKNANNTNHSAAVSILELRIDDEIIESSFRTLELGSTFRQHPYHPSTSKRIIQL